MDSSSSGSAERPAGSVSNGPSCTGGVPASPLSPPLSAVDVSPTASLHSNQSFRRPATLDEPPTITVVVQKEGNGYGMKVSGDNPVYVQSVRMGGPAERAGLYSGDKIIKVNGRNVTHSTHIEVVELIKSGPQVLLTVQPLPQPLGRLSRASNMPASSAGASVMPASPSTSSAGSSPISPPLTPGPGRPSIFQHPPHSINRNSLGITGPQPVDHEKLRQLEHTRVTTFQLMLEKERCYVDRLRSELARSNDPKKTQELANAERRVRTLQQQLLMAMTPNPATAPSSTVTSPTSSSEHYEYQVTPHHHYHHLVTSPSNASSISHSPLPILHHSSPSAPDHSRLPEGYAQRPPPLPSRNRPVNHDSPTGTALLGGSSSPLSIFNESSTPSSIPPPLPPRNPSPHIYSQLHSSEGVDSGVHLNQGLDSLHKHHMTPTNRCHASVPQPSQTSTHTHQRAKSSPDPLSMATGDAGSKSMGVTGSVSDLSLGGRRSKGGSGVWDADSPRITPPGTPPPPYGVAKVPGGVQASPDASGTDAGEEREAHPAETEDPSHQPNGGSSEPTVIGGHPVRQPIIAMEDDEMSDQEVDQVEDYGPFRSLSKLWGHTAHLAVFLNYVISNSDPSSLLFYLMTDLYKEGNVKEMRKWAYEIHSVFLVPGAPLRLSNVDENVAREVDEVLLYEAEKEEILRRVFWKARNKAKEELNEELAGFQQKRTAGLGTLFGPADQQLEESIHDKNKEAKIIEQILTPLLEPTIEDIETETDVRRTMLAMAMITVAGKTFGLRSSSYNSIVDRVPTFVSKEKSLKSKIIGKSRKLTIKGHNFVLHQYYTVTHCNHCGLIIWGISPQGYQCTNCQMNIHRYCYKSLEETCAGPLLKKERANDRISKLMEKIRPEREARRKPSSLISSYTPMGKKHGDDHEDGGHLTDGESCHHGDRPVSGVSSGSGGRGSDRRPDPVRESEEHHHPPHHGPRRCPVHGSDGAGRNHEEDPDHSHHPNHHHYRHDSMHHMGRKGSGASINRSESYKERAQKKQLRERRKTSDPNLSKTNDVDADNQGLSYHTNSGSSSNSSSLSSHVNNLDTRSSSLEMVTGGAACGAGGPAAGAAVGASDHNTFASSGWPKVDSVGFTVAWNDSDTEAEPDPPDWTKAVPEEVLQRLTPREKKRQDVINELFHTERSHVRNLKVLDCVFYRPMLEQSILPPEQIQLLFANLDEMLEIHSQFNSAMKAKRRENPIVERVGDILLNMLDGPCGENFERAAAKFCARQQIALESLKESRRSNGRLNSFLNDAEMKPVCRRLQLKDIIPTGMLRLTKYPLLFESLAKYTDDDGKTEGASMGKERSQILRALERSKKILDSVNQAVREAEDQHRLQVIQQRLEKTHFEKADHPMSSEFKNIDLTKYQLIYEGALTWRAGNRSKTVDLHVVLLEEIVILLLKQDDKFVLKFHNVSSGPVGGVGGGGSGKGGQEDLKVVSPIIKLATVLVRPVATDKRAFFLVNTSGAQIYELVAVSSSERKTWFRHISEAAEAYKAREAKNKRPDLPTITPTAQIPSGPTVETPSQPTPPPPAPEAVTPAKAKESEENGEVPNVAVDGSEEGDASKTNDQTAPSATPANAAELEAVTQKAADGKQPSGLEGGSPQQQLSPGAPGLGSSPAPSPGTQRRAIGGVGGSEPLRMVTEECPLIQPSEVVVSQRAVLTAQPVLTPLEKLRRKDEMVMDALVEKHLLVADLLHVPHEEFDSIAEIASEPTPDRDINELLLSAIYHTDNLKVAINETLRVSEEEAVSARSEGTVHTCVGGNVSGCSPRAGGRRTLAHRMPGVPVPPLLNISNALSSTLSLLLKHVKEREEERDRLRRELQRSRELIHARNQTEQRLQWQDAEMLSSESAPETNAESKGEDVDGCESGMRGLDIRASAAEGDVVDSSPQVTTNLNTSLQNSEGEIEDTEEQGKSLGELADDPGGDVYVDALSFGETEVVASKEQAAVVGEMEEDSLEGEVEPLLPVPKAGTDVPDDC